MKKKIALLLSALVLAGVILFCLQALLVPKYMVGKHKEGALISEYYDNAGSNDVIFIGDCEVYENFSPITMWEKYGITSYIRGSAQQLIWQSYYLMEETFQYETPEVIIFDVLSMKDGTPESTGNPTQREAYDRMTQTKTIASEGANELVSILGIDAYLAEQMIANGFTTVQGIASYVQPEDLVDALGISEEQAFAIVDKAKNA